MSVFGVAVGGSSVLDNHLHLLVRLDSELAQGWSDQEVVRRWGRLFPPRDRSRRPLPVSDDWIQGRLKDAKWVTRTRQRLQSLSGFMKSLKEPLSRPRPRIDVEDLQLATEKNEIISHRWTQMDTDNL